MLFFLSKKNNFLFYEFIDQNDTYVEKEIYIKLKYKYYYGYYYGVVLVVSSRLRTFIFRILLHRVGVIKF